MTKEQIIRAWKDPGHRNMLSDAARTLIPEHPAGIIELCDDDLRHVSGAMARNSTFSSCTWIFLCDTFWPWEC